jgi:electron transfer flavoprotein beta subunit
MNIVVCIKQTFDTEARIAINDQGKIDGTGQKKIINPYDEFAVEEGIRLKERHGGEVTVVTLGQKTAREALLMALAMGADRGLFINTGDEFAGDEWLTTKILTKAVAALSYDLILTGRMDIDECSAQVGIRLAEQLNIPSVNSVLGLTVVAKGEGYEAIAVHEIDSGMETVAIPLPAVFTAQKGLNEPRYPIVAGILGAKRKPLTEMTLADLGFTSLEEPKVLKLTYDFPTTRPTGRILIGEPPEVCRELTQLLLEAKVL